MLALVFAEAIYTILEVAAQHVKLAAWYPETVYKTHTAPFSSST